MDRNLEDIDSLSVNYFAVGGPVGEMSSAQSVSVDGPLSMAHGGLIDINSLSVSTFADGGEVNADLSNDPNIRLVEESQKMLSNLRGNLGPVEASAVRKPQGYNARLSTSVEGVEPYVDVDPLSGRLSPTEYGVRYGQVGPQGGYELRYSQPVMPNVRVPAQVSGQYVQPIGKNASVQASGFYVPVPGAKDAYGANVRYVQRFEDGGEARSVEDLLLENKSLDELEADTAMTDPERKEWEENIPINLLNSQLRGLVDSYRRGEASERDLMPFFPGYNTFDIARLFGKTDEGDIGARDERQTPLLLNQQSYNRAVDRARMEDYNVERDIREKSPNIYPHKRDFALQQQQLAQGGEVSSEDAATEADVARMYAALQGSEEKADTPNKAAVKRIIPRSTVQGSQQKPSLARQQLYSLPPYSLDLAGKLGQAGPIRRADGSPEYGEVAEQMTVGTPLPTDQESPADTAANKMLRALSEGARGFVGAEALEPGSEAYRTGQALANMPAVGIAAGTAKGASKAVSEVAKAKPKSLTKKDIREIAGELETSRGQLAELVKKYPQLRDASVADVEMLTNGEPFTAYRGISLLPGRELRREATPSMTMDPSVAMGILKGAPVMITKDGFIMSTPVLRQYPGMRPSETQVYVPSLIEQIIERQPGALEMRIPTRSGEKMTVADIFKEVKGEKELLADVSKKEPQDVLFNRYQGGVGDRYLMEVARKVLAGEWKGGESLVKEIGGYQTDPKALAKEFDEFAEMVKKRSAIKKAVGGEVSNEDFIQQTITGTPLPTDQGPSLARQGLDLLKQAGQTVYGNLREAVVDPRAFHTRALGNIAQQLQSNPEEFVMNWTGGGLGGIIRPKGGGNLLAGDVEKAIAPLRPRDAYSSEFVSDLKKAYEALVATGEPSKIKVADRMKFDIEQNAPETALDDWIRNKFGNYVKKQMGTEDDPIRKLADEMSEKVQADYQAGLKRIAKMKEDIAKAKARGKNTDVSEAELADEIDRVEQAFQETSILPTQLANRQQGMFPSGTDIGSDLARARQKAGFSPFETAASTEGRAYEQMADIPFVPLTKKDLSGERKAISQYEWSDEILQKNPWISKLQDQDVVYRLRDYDLNEKQIFTHTIDELRNALNPNSGLPQNLLLKPEDMQGLGIEKAFRHVNKINDWRSQQRVAANLEEAKRSAVTIKEYADTPKRLKWQQLKPMEYTELPPGYSVTSSYEGPALFGPDGKKLTTFSAESEIPVQQQALNFIAKNDLEKALQYEGSTMRHCVGGYCDDVWSGQTNIFSLRDKKGEPHVTIETAPSKGMDVYEFYQSNLVPESLLTKITEAEKTGMFDKSQTAFEKFVKDSDEYQNYLKSLPEEILQIKGKGNAKPKEEYIPFVQDFIKSQQWSHIGDYKNANITAISPTGKFAMDLKRAGYDVPRYITDEEFDRLADIRDALLDQSKKNQ